MGASQFCVVQISTCNVLLPARLHSCKKFLIRRHTNTKSRQFSWKFKTSERIQRTRLWDFRRQSTKSLLQSGEKRERPDGRSSRIFATLIFQVVCFLVLKYLSSHKLVNKSNIVPSASGAGACRAALASWFHSYWLSTLILCCTFGEDRCDMVRCCYGHSKIRDRSAGI